MTWKPLALACVGLLTVGCFTDTSGSNDSGDDASGGSTSDATSDSGSDSATTSSSTSVGSDSATSSGTTTTTATTTAGTDASTTDPTSDSATGSSTTDASTSGGSSGGGSTTGADPCDTQTHDCVPPAPPNWTGPVIVANVKAGDTLPPCGGNYPTEVGTLHKDVQVPGSQCDCECASPTGFSCDGGTVTHHTLANCSGTETTTNLTANACVQINQTGWFDMTSDPPTGGSCEPQPTENIPNFSWDSDTRLCTGEPTGDACAMNGLCVPKFGSPFVGVCVVMDGDLPCPAGPYVNREVFHADATDTRKCDDCTCGGVTGTCNGLVNLYSNSNCSGLVGGVGGANCNSAGGNQVLSTRFTASNPILNCPPQSNGLLGDVEVTGPVTVCCL